MSDISVIVTAFVCDGCRQQQMGEPAAALCVECERTRETHAVAAGGHQAAARVLLEGIERTMRLYVDQQVMTSAMRVDVAHHLDLMIEHAFAS